MPGAAFHRTAFGHREKVSWCPAAAISLGLSGTVGGFILFLPQSSDGGLYFVGAAHRTTARACGVCALPPILGVSLERCCFLRCCAHQYPVEAKLCPASLALPKNAAAPRAKIRLEELICSFLARRVCTPCYPVGVVLYQHGVYVVLFGETSAGNAVGLNVVRGRFV